MDLRIRRAFLGSSGLVGIAALVALVAVGPRYREARRADAAAGEALERLVGSYESRNTAIPERLRSARRAFPAETRAFAETGPASLRSLDQSAFLEFDRREQALLAELAPGDGGPRAKTDDPRWVEAERSVVVARAEYTDAAFERNAAWGRMPAFVRDWLGKRPYPHFRADLAERRRLLGEPPVDGK